MIIFKHSPVAIQVMRLHQNGKTDNLGKIFRTTIGDSPGILGRTEWVWDGCYRNMEAVNWDGSDKRAIIGLLDDLNGIRFRTQNTMLDRWNKIIRHLTKGR